MSPEKQAKRKPVEDYFRKVATEELQKNKQIKELSDFLDQNGKKRYLFLIKESIGDIFLCTSLFRSIKDQYPDHDLYVACEPMYFEILEGNPYIHRVIPYSPAMESEIQMTGSGNFKGYFNVYCNVALATQKYLNYLTNSNLSLNLKY